MQYFLCIRSPTGTEAFGAMLRDPQRKQRHLWGFNNQPRAVRVAPQVDPFNHARYLPSICAYNGQVDAATFETCKVVNVYVHVKGGKRQPQVNFAGVAADAAMAKMLNDGEAKRKFPTWCISGRSGASTNVLNDNSVGQRRNPSLCERRMFRVHNMNKVLPDFDLTKLTASTDCQVIVSTCIQESFMSGLEMCVGLT
jgi:hypothetical protein